MIAWNEIETVLLDMDGTLLDLYFDNFFWQEYLPEKWGEMHALDRDNARERLVPRFRNKAGTLSWYCVDFWSQELDIDIMALKSDLEHLIQIRPHSESLLQFLRDRHKPIIMVTNAHQKLIGMKMDKTRIGRYFDQIFCAHQLGAPKEDLGFWERLSEQLMFTPEKTLLIDDNLTVLRTAREFGIGHLLTIAQPDSRAPLRIIEEFPVIESFEQLLVKS